MKEGIYHVQFASTLGASGEGLAVIKSGAINGGDASHLYTGQLTAQGANLSGDLAIRQWNTRQESVFGPIADFQLVLNGAFDGETFHVEGNVVGQPLLKILINGRFLALAA